MADDLKSLERQLAQLEANKEEQIAKQFESLASTILWLEDIIDRNIFNLGIVIASYSVFIAQRAAHLGQTEVALGVEQMGFGIETLVTQLKNFNMVQASRDQAQKAAVQETDTPVDTLVKTQLADIQDSITQFSDSLNELITQTGSFIESSGNIIGTTADIVFDVQRIYFDLISLAAQIFEHEKQIEHTVERIDQAIIATELGVENLIKIYDDNIASKEQQIEQRIAFENESDDLVATQVGVDVSPQTLGEIGSIA